MKIDALIRGGPAEAPGEAAAARAAGYDGLHSAELHHDPFLLLARAVGGAPELEFGTSIAVAFARSPMTVAYSAWDLQEHVRSQLARFKAPRHVFVADQLPVLATGKIDKKLLRARYADPARGDD